jgi:acetyl-CoA acyltransferase
MRQAVIVAGARTAIGKAVKGSLKDIRSDDMGAAVLKDLLRRVPLLDPQEIDDVILGTSFPEGVQGHNFGRQVALLSGLPISVPGFTINRFCSSGLQSISIGAERIMSGFADVIIAGGVESMSMIPMGSVTTVPHPDLLDSGAYMSMGDTAENVASRFDVSREDQDLFSLRSHQMAAKAIDEGKFKNQMVPIKVRKELKTEDGGISLQEMLFHEDEGVRRDTSIEKLRNLQPVFQAGGTVTPGNSSQTSDGAAMVMMMSDKKAAELGLTPIAIYRSYAVGGVQPEVMGIGPVVAVPKALERAGITLNDIDLIELNEAFASQALYVIRHLNFDLDKTNVNGGAIAVGHPLGCTGARLTVDILEEMKRRNSKYGLVTMCIAGGMGAAGIFEMAK